MAVPTTTINGKVLLPNAVGATDGRVTFTLSIPGVVNDGTNDQVVGGPFTADIDSSGNITGLVVVPTDVITPSGRYYDALFEVTSPVRASWTKQYLVASTPDPVYIGALVEITVTVGQTTGALGTISYSGILDDFETAYPASATYRGWRAIVRQGGALADYELRCLRTAGGAYSWVVVAAGE